MSLETKVLTLASSVYDQIRQDILLGEFKPGERLRIEALRTRYCTGASPIREALNRLVSESLVIVLEQRGFRVPPVSIDDLEQLTRARCLLNVTLLTEAIANADADDDEALVLAHYRLSKVPEILVDAPTHLNPEWAMLHTAFHEALIRPCRSPWLIEFDRILATQAFRYRSLTAGREFPPRDVLGEHNAIFQSFLKRDTAGTIAVLNAHITETTDRLIEAELAKKQLVA